MNRSAQFHKQPPYRLIGFAILLFLAGSYSVVRFFIDRHHFTEGTKAYQAKNCPSAISQFDQILNGQRLLDWNDYQTQAENLKIECEAFQAAVAQQKTGKAAEALLAYDRFTDRYQASPLISLIKAQAPSLFQPKTLKAVATPAACERIDALQGKGLMPKTNTVLPAFLQNCGQAFEAKKQFGQAANLYDRFLKSYPKHAEVGRVKMALARSLVAEARQAGAGKIMAPGQSGYAAYGSTLVSIRNDSPEKMRIVFSGPEPRFEELPACTDCTKFQNMVPNACPEKGPVGEYKLAPGKYDVVVTSISDRGVRPFTGTWNLVDGSAYGSCFYIVQKRSIAP
ncbi:MAG: hypothetical protein SFW36_14415 [Leptolyngbyaceae cyanobacterium bins.59]|nr:hypothetical protein [Leptolyngbyaceae cyanobacterium bins.59]